MNSSGGHGKGTKAANGPLKNVGMLAAALGVTPVFVKRMKSIRNAVRIWGNLPFPLNRLESSIPYKEITKKPSSHIMMHSPLRRKYLDSKVSLSPTRYATWELYVGMWEI